MSDFCPDYHHEADDLEFDEGTTMREWISFDGETLDLCDVEIVTYACGHSRRFATPVGLLTLPEDPTGLCFHCERGDDEECFLDPFTDDPRAEEPEPIIRCSAYDGGQGCLRPATEFSDQGYAYCSRCWKLASTEGE